MNRVVIGIPIYKGSINEFEKIALQQVDKVLNKYKKVFIAPESLKFDYQLSYETVRFSDKYFINTESYSDLLTSREFYDVFEGYEFLLIYQLDAFVFHDSLMKFCLSGYDYIGAPLKAKDWSMFHVGNGGLSLRNLRKCARIINFRENILKDFYRDVNPTVWAEDVFWGYCGKRKDIDFEVPSPRDAAKFSVQTDYVQGLRNIKEKGLPFGCHYWWKLNYNFWTPYIESYGYKLKRIETPESLKIDELRRLMYLIKRRGRMAKMRTDLFNCKKYSIYGGGVWGRRCIELFAELRINVECIYDKNKDFVYINNVPVVFPHLNELAKCKTFIIIATFKYEKEIKHILNKSGKIEGRDFCTLYDFCRKIKSGNSL